MRLLLDECLPKPLKRYLAGHEVVTVPEAGFAGVKNGALLSRMSGQFEVFITVDANLKYQQNLSALKVAIVVLRAHSNDLSDLLPLVPQVLVTLDTIQTGDVIEIGA
jgi:hypothetical protein